MADQTVTLTIDKFLGLRIDTTGDTNLQPGELSECKNARITENYKVRKRPGYEKILDTVSAGKKIQGMWYGKLSGTYHFLFACNGHIYELNLSNDPVDKTDLGTLTDAYTAFFAFSDILYILNGKEYKKWTGTGSIANVTGYRPILAVASDPDGAGTEYEEINILTGAKCQRYSTVAGTKDYKLPLTEQSADSIDYVKLNGALIDLTTDYTVDSPITKVSLVADPGEHTDNLEIGWTKGTGTPATITANKAYNLFGGSNDTRVFLYGNGNTVVFSGLADGVPSAEYFPANNSSRIGSDEFDVTYLITQYDRQLIFQEPGGGASYCVYSFDSALNKASFPTYPLNNKIGNKPFGQGQLIQNNPVTIDHGAYDWNPSTVRDERNAVFISDRVQLALDSLDLSTAITLDYEDKGEYWLCVDKVVYIYNYRNNTWYHYDLTDTPNCFVVVDGDLYMGTSGSQIMRFDENLKTDNGQTFEVRVETGFLDFGAAYVRKFLNFMYISLQAEVKARCSLEWETDVTASSTPEVIYYNLVDYSKINYDDDTYLVNYNLQPFSLKSKIKKFVYLKLIFTNSSATDAMTLMSIVLPAMLGGTVK